MPKQFMMLIIGLFFGTGGGFLLAAANDVTLSGHDHSMHNPSTHEMHADGGGHDHSKLMETNVQSSISLDVRPDGPNAWNLHLMVENFTFAPERVNGDHIDGEGHAHIYVDGSKIARTYSPWFHLVGMPDDAKEIRVTLNANSHETLSFGGEPIEASIRLDQ